MNGFLEQNARAGSTFQGSTFQGSTFQGSTFQGSTFQGPEFCGHGLAGPFEEELACGEVLEPLSFRGDVVDVARVDAGGGPVMITRVHARELVGLQWAEPLYTDRECLVAHRRIAAVEPDPSRNTMPAHSDNSDIWLYRVQYTTEDWPGEWFDVCNPGSGLFVDGHWKPDGSWSPDGHTFSCQGGVIAKCARGWGYKPWKSLTATDGSQIDLQPLHQACTRAARADYVGDGVSHTRDGVLVDMFDMHGFNVPEYLDGFVEEARFDMHGALSVHHTRLADDPFDVAGFMAGRTRSRAISWPASGEIRRSTRDTALLHVWSRPGARH